MCRKIKLFYFLILVSDYSEEGFFENKTKLKPKIVIESNIFFLIQNSFYKNFNF